MRAFITEKEFRQSGAASAGITINVAFLQEIKADYGFRGLLNDVYYKLKPVDSSASPPTPHDTSRLLGNLRDELQTYFALEEFYGYFNNSEVSNPCVGKAAHELKTEHERLFIQLNELVDLSEQIVYREAGPDASIEEVHDAFESFCADLAAHEQNEMELMMRLCNEEIGVGD